MKQAISQPADCGRLAQHAESEGTHVARARAVSGWEWGDVRSSWLLTSCVFFQAAEMFALGVFGCINFARTDSYMP